MNNQIQLLSREVIHIVDNKQQGLNESQEGHSTPKHPELVATILRILIIFGGTHPPKIIKIREMSQRTLDVLAWNDPGVNKNQRETDQRATRVLELNHFSYFFQLDETFKAINHILLWLQQQANSLHGGFSLLANGHLAP
ncbi:hypothetical protein OUZ56_032147 [Daphnia magna]|uniref:Uncharacterized protein n=1 Tax=Daphnia magna TaxID=35525 RepID=A0ABQ9ZWM7_9CRUS|nr:hypothetical protein OUZ56_032147 [Daphnia magna]